MKTTVRHIEYLISRNDCVIIPGLGAILATTDSAQYDPLTHTLLPPHREYTFCTEICQDDDAIATSIQLAESMSAEDARRLVYSEVAEIISDLASGQSVEIGCAGALNREATSGAITFTPNVSATAINYMWLKPLRLRSLISEQEGIIDAPIRREASWAFSSWVRAAAIVCLVLVGITISTPVSVENAIMLASLAPQVSQIPQEQLLPAAPSENTALEIATTAQTVSTDAEAAPAADMPEDGEATISPAPTTDAATVDADKPLYYVIVASLVNDDEARLYLQMHPDLPHNILSTDRRSRIYISVHDNIEDAKAANREATKTFPEAWIFKSPSHKKC